MIAASSPVFPSIGGINKASLLSYFWRKFWRFWPDPNEITANDTRMEQIPKYFMKKVNFEAKTIVLKSVLSKTR